MPDPRPPYMFADDGIYWTEEVAPVTKTGFQDHRGEFIPLFSLDDIGIFHNEEAAFWQAVEARIDPTPGKEYWPQEAHLGWKSLKEVRSLQGQGQGIAATVLLEKVIAAYDQGIFLTKYSPTTERAEQLMNAGRYVDAAKVIKEFFERCRDNMANANAVARQFADLTGAPDLPSQVDELRAELENNIRGTARTIMEDAERAMGEALRRTLSTFSEFDDGLRDKFNAMKTNATDELRKKYDVLLAQFREEAAGHVT